MARPESELDALEDLLLSLPAEDDGMLLSEFDGFCAGLVVCPEVIPPGEWLPLVWGDPEGPDFETLEDARRGTELVMAHYNRVAGSLMPPAEGYGAIFEVDSHSGETLWELWFSGFAAAISLRPGCWDAVADSGDDAALQAVILFARLHLIASGQGGLDAETTARLTEAAPELIPDMVLTLNAWTKGQARPPAPFGAMAAGTPARPFHGRKTGRNAPCPCGSGRKYKRCCGAN